MVTFRSVQICVTVLLLVSLMQPVNAILNVLVDAMLGAMFRSVFENGIGQVSHIILGGPTSIVRTALVNATPFLAPSMLGERVERLLLSLLSTAASFISKAISLAVNLGVSLPVNAGISAAKAGLSVVGNLITQIPFVRDLAASFIAASPLALAANITSSAGSRNLQKPSSFSRRTLFSNEGKINNFIKSLENDDRDCLKTLICSIHADEEDTLSYPEKNLKTMFRDVAIYSPPAEATEAARLGSLTKSEKKCQKRFSKCWSPSLYRFMFKSVPFPDDD